MVGLIPSDRSLLVPGAAVTVRATRSADGALTAVSVQVEKDGVKPLPQAARSRAQTWSKGHNIERSY